MHPTLRHCLETASHAVSFLFPRHRRPGQAKAKRRIVPELTPLEERQLLYFSVNASIVPSTLWPPNGRYVPVTITGTAREFSIQGNKQVFENLGGPKKANFIVTDEYRQDEPYGPIKLVHQGGGTYTFKVTFHLQAKRSDQFIAGRRYYINVAAMDDDGWGSKQLVVQVPKSLENRGPGPLQPWPQAEQANTKAQGHPNGRAAARLRR